MSENKPTSENPPPVGGVDLNTIFTLLQSLKEKQDSDSLVYKATFTEFQDKISSLELGQQLLTSASPANAAPSRPSAERRQTIFGTVSDVDGNQEIKAVIQPRVLFAKEDLQKVPSLWETRGPSNYIRIFGICFHRGLCKMYRLVCVDSAELRVVDYCTLMPS